MGMGGCMGLIGVGRWLGVEIFVHIFFFLLAGLGD